MTTMNEDNISETSHPQSFNTPITPANDPSTWRHSSKAQKEIIIQNCFPENPQCFPRDSFGRSFPTSIFYQDLPNGEKVKRDWLVWSSSVQGLFCFPCCLFQDLSQQDKTSRTSQLTRTDAGLKDHWRKLYDKIDTHQRNSTHILCYLTWKDLEKSLNESTGIDHNLKNNLMLKC